MTNRINELEKFTEITKSLDNLINTIASHSNRFDTEKEEIISTQIQKVSKLVDYVGSFK